MTSRYIAIPGAHSGGDKYTRWGFGMHFGACCFVRWCWHLCHRFLGTCPDRGYAMEVEHSVAVSCLFLPKIDAVEVVLLSMNTRELWEFDNWEAHRLLEILDIPDGRTPRMILLFTDRVLHIETDEDDPAHLLLKHYGNVVIAGGLVDVLYPQPDDETGWVVMAHADYLVGHLFNFSLHWTRNRTTWV